MCNDEDQDECKPDVSWETPRSHDYLFQDAATNNPSCENILNAAVVLLVVQLVPHAASTWTSH